MKFGRVLPTHQWGLTHTFGCAHYFCICLVGYNIFGLYRIRCKWTQDQSEWRHLAHCTYTLGFVLISRLLIRAFMSISHGGDSCMPLYSSINAISYHCWKLRNYLYQYKIPAIPYNQIIQRERERMNMVLWMLWNINLDLSRFNVSSTLCTERESSL